MASGTGIVQLFAGLVHHEVQVCKFLCKIINKGRAFVSLFEKIQGKSEDRFLEIFFSKDLKDKGKNNFPKYSLKEVRGRIDFHKYSHSLF